MIRRPPRCTRNDTLLPYTTLFRSPWLGLGAFDFHHRLMPVRIEPLPNRFDPGDAVALEDAVQFLGSHLHAGDHRFHRLVLARRFGNGGDRTRSEEHTSELQSLMRI